MAFFSFFRSPAGAARRWSRGVRSLFILSICALVAGTSTYALDRVAQEVDKEEFEQPLVAMHPDPLESMKILPPSRLVSLARMRAQMEDDGDTTFWKTGSRDAGTRAPDFSLPDNQDGHQVSLAAFRGKKPVVLMFGSFSCTLFCEDVPQLERLYQSYKNSAQFLFIHVRDARHPIPELSEVLDALPPTFANRSERARRAMHHLGLSFPCVIDTADGELETFYDAYPRRLMIVDAKGKVALDEGQGLNDDHWNFKEVEAWLRGHAN